MRNIILLKNYNNYFNRIIKKSDKVDDYIKDHNYHIIDAINFNPRDGVNTEFYCNMKQDNLFVPDYALIVDTQQDKFGNTNYVILSRWFIVEWVFVSGTQYKAQMRCDVIADNLDKLQNAPFFVEKGYINDVNNSLIFNSEGMSYNEIKTRETLLKDETKIGWLVGYMIQKFPETETEKLFTAEYSYIDGADVATPWEDVNKLLNINFDSSKHERTFGTIQQYIFKTAQKLRNDSSNYTGVYESTFTRKHESGFYLSDVNLYNLDYQSLLYYRLWSGNSESDSILATLLDWMADNKKDIIEKLFKPKFNSAYGALKNIEIEKMDGKLIVGPDGKLYNLKVSPQSTLVTYHDLKNESSTQDEIKIFKELISQNPTLRSHFQEPTYNQPKQTLLYLAEKVNYYEINAIPAEVYSATLETTVKNSRNHLADAPYDMFCIPFDINNVDQTVIRIDGETFELSNILSLVMAKGMAISAGGLGSGNTYVYDVQYLPYCPIPKLKDSAILTIDESGRRIFNIVSSLGFEIDKDYSIVTKKNDTKDKVSILFWATKRSGTFNIPYYKDVSYDPIEFKVQNETEKLRICSPNYAGLFEFSPAKNRGVRYINVDYTYKPFNPYIHINPIFDGLYGSDFNDLRGLIVGGDFSLETLSDKFTEYELRNKNYAQMFDREIQNMDVNNKINLTSDIVASTLGGVTSGVGGAVAGGMVGGVGGAVAGGLTGGIGSLLGGAADIALGQQSYRENRSFKTDMFNYQLGNVKALPRSLTKTSAFTYNHKIFPFIEEYECTDIEKQALRNKLKYNGMTIMIIDNLSNYINNIDKKFFKGQLIRCTDISEDSHILNVIYEELNKGVYL